MFYKLKMKKVLPCPNIERYNRFLFIGAHACDIEKGAGATACKLCGEHKEVKFVIATDSASTANIETSYEERKELRQKEELCSATVLGVKEVEFLPFEDFGNYDVEDMQKELLSVISAYKPEVIFIADYHTPNEINIDDKNVSIAVENVFCIITNKIQAEKHGVEYNNIKALAYYNSLKKNYYIGTIGFSQTKLQSIMVQTSLLPKKAEDVFGVMRSYKYIIDNEMLHDGIRAGKLKAEGFRVVSAKAIHNMPQIN